MTGDRAARPGGAALPASGPAAARWSTAAALAVALHLAVFAPGMTGSRSRLPMPSVVATTMTVRYVAPSGGGPSAVAPAPPAPSGEVPSASKPAPAPAPAAAAASAASLSPPPKALSPGPDASALANGRTAPDAPQAGPPKVPSHPPEAVAALPAAPDYLLGAALDPGPQPIGEIEPEYPDSANLQEGVVVIRVLISDTGHVDNVAVVKSEPKGLFEDAAIVAFARAQFSPGRAAGVAVKSQITVEVHFLPINRGARISGRSY